MKKLLVLLGGFLALQLIQAEPASARLLPFNGSLPRSRQTGQMTFQQYRAVVTGTLSTFQSYIYARRGTLQLDAKLEHWNDNEVNAFASRTTSEHGEQLWQLIFPGGLARHPLMTPDGYALVVCHELGHLLAGYPFYPGELLASEGQSDYFSTQVCARRIFRMQAQATAKFQFLVDKDAKLLCDRAWRAPMDRNVCYRTAMAGLTLSRVLNDLSQNPVLPQFRTRDLNQVAGTDPSHPAAQCRLDTYINGAMCNVDFNVAVIPGLNEQMNNGSLYDEERQAARYSCGSQGRPYDGARPGCWFKQLTH